MIFTTTTQLKTAIGGSINVSLELDSINPTLLDVAEVYVLPYLGQTTFDALRDYVAADYTPTDAALNALLPYARAPIGAIGAAEYSKLGGIQFGESGLFRIETDDKKSPYKYQENDYRYTLLTQGYNSIERMILFLEKNKADYPDWVDEAREYCRGLFVSTAADLRAAYGKGIDRQIYEVLRPLIADMEVFLILSSIGQEQFDALKELQLEDATTLTYAQSQALTRLRKAISLGAIQESLRRNIIQLKGDRIIQAEALEPQSSLKEGVPANPALSLSSVHMQEWKERHLSYFLKWLTDNPTTFPEYETYLAAEAAAEAAASTADCTGDPTWSPCPDDPDSRCSLGWLTPPEYTPRSGTGIVNL